MRKKERVNSGFEELNPIMLITILIPILIKIAIISWVHPQLITVFNRVTKQIFIIQEILIPRRIINIISEIIPFKINFTQILPKMIAVSIMTPTIMKKF